jgi:hypothetical protein
MCGPGCLQARPYIALHHTLAVVAQFSRDAERIWKMILREGIEWFELILDAFVNGLGTDPGV